MHPALAALGAALAAATLTAACADTSPPADVRADIGAPADAAVDGAAPPADTRADAVAPPADAAPGDAAAADTAPADLPDLGAPPLPDVGPDTAPLTPSDYGFPGRVPQERRLTCDNGDPFSFPDHDFLCRVTRGEFDALLYSKATPGGCPAAGWPTWQSEQWLRVAGAGAQLVPGSYDWIRNHHMSWLWFGWDGLRYNLSFSAYTFGGPCGPFDCLYVTTPEGQTVEAGCGEDRALPVVCKAVAADGTVEPLVDTFQGCPD